jgi:hypothetical protein
MNLHCWIHEDDEGELRPEEARQGQMADPTYLVRVEYEERPLSRSWIQAYLILKHRSGWGHARMGVRVA